MKFASDIRRSEAARSAHKVVCWLATGIFLVSCSFADEPTDSFDTPIKTVRVELGPSPFFEDPDIRNTLSCYYYPHLVIKEYSERGFGAAWLSMLRHRGNPPACEPTRQRGERLIDESEWQGWFKGVRDTLVFFDPPDDFNGHSPFAVFDSVSGKKIFEDSAYGEHVSSPDYLTSRVRVIATADGYLLRYMRVADADCDLHLEGSPCWEEIKAQLSLKSEDMPVCTGYDYIAQLIGTDHVESVIAYPVEVSLFPRPTTKIVAGAAKCWAAQ
jgi:hypothetical protein